MGLHNCPICDSGGASRRRFLAGLGATATAAVLPAGATLGQATPKLIDTHHQFHQTRC
jgi:hypothetical protein